jgi:Plasmid recombination enzyme/Toprim-like/Protein of unknown function (DUF3991)
VSTLSLQIGLWLLLWAMSYAILRTAKLTAIANISGSARHNFRERETPNADPQRTPQNSTHGAQSTKELIAGVKFRLATVPTIRKNAVLAIEYFIGASPEWFKEQTEATREAYFDRAEQWLKQRHGSDNVIAFTRQYDETSPHVCAYVVPIDPKGKLNCSYFLDGRTKLSEMQTDFAEKCGKPFRLERGMEGSKATHKTIRQYYAEIQAQPKDVAISPELLQPKLIKKGVLFSEYENPQMVADRVTKAVQSAYRPAVQAAKQYEVDKVANEARELQLSHLRATATQARELPLRAVLERLGATPDASDKNNWKTPLGRLTLNGAKFFNQDLNKGGGGAIDLVMHQLETDYKGAVHWLANTFGTGVVLSDNVAKLKSEIQVIADEKIKVSPLKPHESDRSNWHIVRNYLIDKRGISTTLVDELHQQGLVYADKYRNAVFVLGDKAGVELRGTSDKAFHGVRGEKSLFALRERGENKVAFVESAIDAMSLHDLGFKGHIVSTSGTSVAILKATADIFRNRGIAIVAAFDNDRAGDQMALHLGQCERLRPKNKDWNDDLRSKLGLIDSIKSRSNSRSVGR